MVVFGDNPIPKVKNYLSDLFRKSSGLLSIASMIEHQEKMAFLHQNHTNYSMKLINLLYNGEINDYRKFLALIQQKMKSGEIFYKQIPYLRIN